MEFIKGQVTMSWQCVKVNLGELKITVKVTGNSGKKSRSRNMFSIWRFAYGGSDWKRI